MKRTASFVLGVALLLPHTVTGHHSFDAEFDGFTRVDTIGHPMSARARITQTFKRVNFGTIEHTFTLTDPKTYTSPWTVHDTWALEPDTKLLEYACMENNRAFYEGRIKPFVPPDDVD